MPILDLAQSTAAWHFRYSTAPAMWWNPRQGFADADGAASRARPCMVQAVSLARHRSGSPMPGSARADTAAVRAAARHRRAGRAGRPAPARPGLGVARRITRPDRQVHRGDQRHGRGDRSARAGRVRGRASCASSAPPSTRWPTRSTARTRSAATWWPTSLMSCARRSRCSRPGHEALLDGVAEPTPEELSSLRDEVLRLARMIAICRRWPPPTPPRCTWRDTGATWRTSPPQRPTASRAGSRPPRSTLNRALSSVPGPRRPALAAPGGHGPAHQRAEVHPGRRQGRRSAPGRRVWTPCSRSPTRCSASPPKTCPCVFDRFWRGRSPRVQTSGSGIGLAIAAELAHAHGGELTAASAAGARAPR